MRKPNRFLRPPIDKSKFNKRKNELPAEKRAKVKSYIRKQSSVEATFVEAIACKLCGGVIAKYVEGEGTLGSFKAKNGNIITRVPMVFSYLSNYHEIKMQFDNGSFHISQVCKDCFNRGLTADDLETIYLADIEQMMEEGDRLSDLWLDRFPFRVVEDGDKGLV